MIISEKLLEELIALQNAVHQITCCNSMTEIQLENFLKEFEKEDLKF